MQMKWIVMLFVVVGVLPIWGVHLTPSSDKTVGPKGEIVLESLWKEIYGAKVPFPRESEKVKESVLPTPSQNPPPKEEKVLSRGEEYIQSELAKNREKIKELRAKESQEKAIKQAQASAEGNESPEDFLKRARSDVKQQYKEWKDDVEKTYQRWREERDRFLKRIPEYKKGLAEIPSITSAVTKKVSEQEKMEAVTPSLKKNLPYRVVAQSLEIPIKDQGKRSTCSAFAAIRSIEIFLWQSFRQEQLSEEYFYWASRPDCYYGPCSKRGSWVTPGLDYSSKQSKADIPPNRFCPYKEEIVADNDTHTPLNSTCLQTGKVRIVRYQELTTLNQVMAAIEKNQAVIAGFRLSENFYTNQGLVLDAEVGKKLDQHALGHALVLVGFMELPPEHREKGGGVCFIAANSWGEGYGRGGYSCLSEKWIQHYRGNNPFVAIELVEVTE